MKIGWFQVPLSSFRLDFFEAYRTDDLASLQGAVDAEDLGTSAQIINGVFEHNRALDEVAHEFAVPFHPRPTPKDDPATRMRLIKRVLEKFDEPVRRELERFVERSAELRSRGEEPDPRDIERLTELLAESRKPRDQ